MKTIKELYRVYKIYIQLKEIRKVMSQIEIEYYLRDGLVESDINPKLLIRYDELIEEREALIRELSWI